GLLVLLIFVGLPHAALGYYGLKSRSTINAVFPSGPQATPPVTVTASTTSTTTTLRTTTTFGMEREALYPVLTAPTTTTATTTTLPLGVTRITVLLLGGDAGPGRSGLRTDTMIVASVETVTGDAVLFGLPRDMTGFTFSDGSPFPGLGKGLLNEVYPWGNRHPELFGGIDPGASAIKDVAVNLLGIPIDYFVLVDMAGFAEMVDVMGGVTISVRKDVIAPIYNRENGTHVMTTISAGAQILDGDLALAYARSRTGSNDYSRMARQRCVLTALAEQIDPLSLLPRLGEVLDTVKENVTTDISPEQIPVLVNLAPVLSSERVLVVGFDRGYRLGTVAEGSLRPNVDRIRAAVQQAITNPGSVDPDLGMTPASEACG
ncbi:MAG: LCP family protein, partial [Acidimicrobiia bacterium]